MGFTLLLAKIVAALVWIGKLFIEVFVALWDLVCDAACWPFEQLMTIVLNVVNGLDLSPILGGLAGFGALPAEVLNILGLIGVHQAIVIIVAAIGIRLVLQLIPFVRLGS